MATPSTTAGKACAECGIPDPCILDVTTDFPSNKESHRWSREGRVHFDLLDDGEGAKGTITITSQCDHQDQHKAWLEEQAGNTKTALKADGTPNNVLLHYKGENGNLAVEDIFRTPWEYLSSVTSPADVFDEPAHYRVRVDSCYECGTYAEIDVYPALEIRFTTGLSYELTSTQRKRTVKERRDEQIKSRQAMEDTKPKNNNKLRSGWQDQTAEFEFINKTMLNVSFCVKVCNTEFSEKYKQAVSKRCRNGALAQLGRIDSLLDRMNTYFAPDPESANSTRQYSVFSCTVAPMELGISYAYQYTDVQKGPCHFFGLYGSPFLKATLRFDIIQFICVYCKIESLVARCRDYLRKHGTSVECYLEIEPGVNLNFGAAYSKKNEEWTFNLVDDSQLYLGLKGGGSATFEAEVFVVELKAQAEGSIDAKACFKPDPHENGLDLVLCHDGVKGHFKFSADVRHRKGKKENERTPQQDNGIEKEWQLCKPLTKEESPLRVNLYGKERMLQIPTDSPPVHEPWAMGSNPNWNK